MSGKNTQNKKEAPPGPRTESERLMMYTMLPMAKFSFAHKAVNWGLGLGSVLALHSYLRHREPRRAVSTGLKMFFLTSFGVYLVFFMKRMMINLTIANYERDTSRKIKLEFNTREFLMKRFRVKDPDVSDEELAAKWAHELESTQDLEKINDLIEFRDFKF